MNQKIESIYQEWLRNAVDDQELQKQLRQMDEKEIEDAFGEELHFGTGGIREKMGPGCRRLNIYTVARATKGLSLTLQKMEYNTPSNKNRNRNSEKRVVIASDTRINSKLFREVAASVLMDDGFNVYLFNEPTPTPILAFAVEELGCEAGIMITASHNTKEYNGYKVYGSDGVQITPDIAMEVQKGIDQVPYFSSYRHLPEEAYQIVDPVVFERFIKEASKAAGTVEKIKPITIAYTSLHGTGTKAVEKILKVNGFENVYLLEEQCKPDGTFPTCSTPNPENPKAMRQIMDFGQAKNADVVFATDPDTDRMGAAIRNGDNLVFLDGNEIGILLLDFLLEKRDIPKNARVLKTIVTSETLTDMAKAHNVSLQNTLNGFKYIGEQVNILADQNRADEFLIGIEENHGYLIGSYVKDKDAVGAVLLFSNMVQTYKNQSVNIAERLQNIYKKYGYRTNQLINQKYEGLEGLQIISGIMDAIRQNPISLPSFSITQVSDYLEEGHELPKDNSIELEIDHLHSIIIRPSGTEPKLKIYVRTKCDHKQELQELSNNLLNELLSAIEQVKSSVIIK